MLGAMRWLVRDANKNDSLFFHCAFVPKNQPDFTNTPIDSGHGSQVRDLNGDEVDGYDEGNANESSSGSTRPNEW